MHTLKPTFISLNGPELDLHQQKVKSIDNLINAPFREFHQLSRAAVKTMYSTQIMGEGLDETIDKATKKENPSMNGQEKGATYWLSDKKQAQLCLDSEELRPSQNVQAQTKINN